MGTTSCCCAIQRDSSEKDNTKVNEDEVFKKIIEEALENRRRQRNGEIEPPSKTDDFPRLDSDEFDKNSDGVKLDIPYANSFNDDSFFIGREEESTENYAVISVKVNQRKKVGVKPKMNSHQRKIQKRIKMMSKGGKIRDNKS